MSKPAATAPGTGRAALAGFALAIALFSAVLVRYTDNFFADDSYFYLQVASNLARGLGSTFNGIMPTNGYHPLWLLICTAVFALFPGKLVAVHAIGVVLALLNLGTLLLTARALRRSGTRCWYVAWLLYAPFCFTSQLGTEGALSGLCLSAFVLTAFNLATAPSSGSASLVGISAGLAVLSRLDNIFIVVLVSSSLLLLVRVHEKAAVRRLTFAALIPLGLWACYVASNLYWFGTVQPISGMLKAHAHGEHSLFTNLPHTAYLDLAIILPGVFFLYRTRADLFSRIIEIPFALGILAHALYIVFVMSSETRWSWYYTSWTLLASIVLARSLSELLERRFSFALPHAATGSAVLLLLAWYFASYRRMAHEDPAVQEAAFQRHVGEDARLTTLLAFDKPGRIAFYTSARIIPLDGLMGSLQFQRELARKGIAAFDAANGVDGFIGPPQPMSESAKILFCDHVFLSSVRFHCIAAGDAWRADRVEVFARLTGQSAGVLALDSANLVWTEPHNVAVWRLAPAAGRPRE